MSFVPLSFWADLAVRVVCIQNFAQNKINSFRMPERKSIVYNTLDLLLWFCLGTVCFTVKPQCNLKILLENLNRFSLEKRRRKWLVKYFVNVNIFVNAFFEIIDTSITKSSYVTAFFLVFLLMQSRVKIFNPLFHFDNPSTYNIKQVFTLWCV